MSLVYDSNERYCIGLHLMLMDAPASVQVGSFGVYPNYLALLDCYPYMYGSKAAFASNFAVGPALNPI